MTLGLRQLLILVALIVFVVAAMGIDVGKIALVPLGLAIFAAAFVVPETALSRR